MCLTLLKKNKNHLIKKQNSRYQQFKQQECQVVQLKKTNHDIKISKLEKKLTNHNHNKYITTPEFNNLVADVFNARLAQANLITKTDFDTKLSSLNRKITANKSKQLLVENESKN